MSDMLATGRMRLQDLYDHYTEKGAKMEPLKLMLQDTPKKGLLRPGYKRRVLSFDFAGEEVYLDFIHYNDDSMMMREVSSSCYQNLKNGDTIESMISQLIAKEHDLRFKGGRFICDDKDKLASMEGIEKAVFDTYNAIADMQCLQISLAANIYELFKRGKDQFEEQLRKMAEGEKDEESG
jgi:hypothetical protein